MEDPATKRHQPRNYLETLEQRVAQLEAASQLQQQGPDTSYDLQKDQNHSISLLRTPDDQLSAHIPARQPTTASQFSDDETEVNDLATEIGMLSVAAGAEPHYLGPSSAVGFSRVINSALLRSIPRRSRDRRRSESRDEPMPGHCLLPDSESCIKLSDAYFQHIHPQYPFLHEPTFRLWEMKLLPSEVTDIWQLSTVSLFFLYMVNQYPIQLIIWGVVYL